MQQLLSLVLLRLNQKQEPVSMQLRRHPRQLFLMLLLLSRSPVVDPGDDSAMHNCCCWPLPQVLTSMLLPLLLMSLLFLLLLSPCRVRYARSVTV